MFMHTCYVINGMGNTYYASAHTTLTIFTQFDQKQAACLHCMALLGIQLDYVEVSGKTFSCLVCGLLEQKNVCVHNMCITSD